MSYRDINYNVRPAKSTERKILVDILRKICVNTEQYSYVGLGSTYFTDFRLFHKELHISKMYSFEKDAGIKPRIEFNKPFNCVEIFMEETWQGLPKLDCWSEKCIVWMDYDDPLNKNMFVDIEILFKRMVAGSFFILTCNQFLRNEANKTYKIEEFREKFGTMVPHDAKQKDLGTKNSATIIRKMILNQIHEKLELRNRTLQNSEKLSYHPIIFMTYTDGAPMVTIGGYLDYKSNKFSISEYGLKTINKFLSETENAYELETPKITYREYELLHKKVPAGNKFLKDKEIAFIPPTEKKQFSELYKYLPNFMDVRQ